MESLAIVGEFNTQAQEASSKPNALTTAPST
jgi:hypothetical protein